MTGLADRIPPLLAATALAASSVSCQRVVDLPNGTWGGDSAEMTVYADRAEARFCCGDGIIAVPIQTDDKGLFTVGGTYRTPRGGSGKDYPAVFRGRVRSTTLTLEVEVTHPDFPQPIPLLSAGGATSFALRYATPGTFVGVDGISRCLCGPLTSCGAGGCR